jgi:hypothetical protein
MRPGGVGFGRRPFLLRLCFISPGIGGPLHCTLLAVDRACVACPLVETSLELRTAPALASRLVHDGGGGCDCRQGIASVGTGIETVVADGLVAWAALSDNILAKLNCAAVGAGLDPGLRGLPVVAGGDAGAANDGTIDRKPVTGSPDNGRGEENWAGCRKKECSHGSPYRRARLADPAMSGPFSFCRGATAAPLGL